jgi:hypothetical protein
MADLEHRMRHRDPFHFDSRQEARERIAANPLHYRLAVPKRKDLGSAMEYLFHRVDGTVGAGAVNRIGPRLRNIALHQVRAHIVDHAAFRHVEEIRVSTLYSRLGFGLANQFVDIIYLEL